MVVELVNDDHNADEEDGEGVKLGVLELVREETVELGEEDDETLQVVHCEEGTDGADHEEDRSEGVGVGAVHDFDVHHQDDAEVDEGTCQPEAGNVAAGVGGVSETVERDDGEKHCLPRAVEHPSPEHLCAETLLYTGQTVSYLPLRPMRKSLG